MRAWARRRVALHPCMLASRFDDAGPSVLGIGKGGLQIYNNIGINITFYTPVTVLYYLLPYFSFPYLTHQRPPVRAPERLLSLVRIQFRNRIQDGKVQTPDFYPRRPGSFSYWRRLIAVFRVWWCDNGEDRRERFGQTTR